MLVLTSHFGLIFRNDLRICGFNVFKVFLNSILAAIEYVADGVLTKNEDYYLGDHRVTWCVGLLVEKLMMLNFADIFSSFLMRCRNPL